jgi:2-methylcitrate dehydratase PrpD
MSAATDPDGVTGALSAWLADLSLADVPPAVRERAKYLLLDGIGCALVGAKLPWSALAVETVTWRRASSAVYFRAWTQNRENNPMQSRMARACGTRVVPFRDTRRKIVRRHGPT